MSRPRAEKAKEAIIAAANAHRAKRYPNLDAYNKRQLQQAVCACRHNGLVDDDTLTLAGFNTKRRSS